MVRCVKNANYSHELIIYLCLCLLAVIGYIGTRIHQADSQEAQGQDLLQLSAGRVSGHSKGSPPPSGLLTRIAGSGAKRALA